MNQEAEFYCVRCDAERESDCSCSNARISTPHPCDVISEQALQDLWGIGFTIVPRVAPDKVFDVAADLAPAGMSYQWGFNPDKAWKPVPASRHPGMFAPYGYSGHIEVGGLCLMERPKAEVDAFHAEAHRKARQNVTDWHDRVAAQGFIGGVTVLQEGSAGRSADIREIGEKTLESVTKIPRDLTPYIAEIFAERDRLWSNSGTWWGDFSSPEYKHYLQVEMMHTDWTRGQLMNAVLTPIAIENIRKKLEGTAHDQSASSHSGSGAVDPPPSGPSAETATG